jgi:CRP-like cAMP-binding protein
MYFILRGEVEIEGTNPKVVLKDGDIVGEMALILSQPRAATVRAKTICDLFVLDKADFARILRDNPQFAERVTEIAKKRFKINVEVEHLTAEAHS